MRLRDIFVSVGCFAAALGLSSGKQLRADDLQPGSETGPQTNLECAGALPAAEAGCERIGGHLRVEFNQRIPDVPGHVRPGASPVAVRSDGGMQVPSHIRLPGEDSGLDLYRR